MVWAPAHIRGPAQLAGLSIDGLRAELRNRRVFLEPGLLAFLLADLGSPPAPDAAADRGTALNFCFFAR